MVSVAASLWGTWSLFFRPAESHGPISAALETFVVFSASFVVATPFALRERPGTRRPLSAWLLVALIGVTDALNALFFFWAMQKTTLAVAVLTHYTAPVLVAIFAPFVLGERLTKRTVVVVAIAFTGLAVLLEPWREFAPGAMHGAGLGLASAIFFASSLLGIKRAGRHFGGFELLAWHMPTALLTLWLFVPRGAFSSIPEPALGWLALACIGPGAIAAVLFYKGVVHLEANRASILMLLEPLTAVLVGIVVWKEVPRPLAALGALLVLISAYMVVKRDPSDARAA
jgi:drug/metabolite transporter (DMT)-like permease